MTLNLHWIAFPLLVLHMWLGVEWAYSLSMWIINIFYTLMAVAAVGMIIWMYFLSKESEHKSYKITYKNFDSITTPMFDEFLTWSSSLLMIYWFYMNGDFFTVGVLTTTLALPIMLKPMSKKIVQNLKKHRNF